MLIINSLYLIILAFWQHEMDTTTDQLPQAIKSSEVKRTKKPKQT